MACREIFLTHEIKFINILVYEKTFGVEEIDLLRNQVSAGLIFGARFKIFLPLARRLYGDSAGKGVIDSFSILRQIHRHIEPGGYPCA